MTRTRRTYSSPPIQEALCEFRFDPNDVWDLTSPAVLIDLLPQYSGPAEGRLDASVEVGQERESQTVRWRPQEQRIALRTVDAKRMLTAGPNTLGVHCLTPYEGWESFSQRISDALVAYERATGPRKLRRAAIRYINRVTLEVGDGGIALSDYFNIPSALPEEMPSTMRSVLIRTESDFDDYPARLLQTFASAGVDEQGRAVLILDLDVVREWEDPEPTEGAMERVEELRDLERLAFETMITDTARELFDAS